MMNLGTTKDFFTWLEFLTGNEGHLLWHNMLPIYSCVRLSTSSNSSDVSRVDVFTSWHPQKPNVQALPSLLFTCSWIGSSFGEAADGTNQRLCSPVTVLSWTNVLGFWGFLDHLLLLSYYTLLFVPLLVFNKVEKNLSKQRWPKISPFHSLVLGRNNHLHLWALAERTDQVARTQILT